MLSVVSVSDIGRSRENGKPDGRLVRFAWRVKIAMKHQHSILAIGPIMFLVRFDLRPDSSGWTIYDRETNEPASVDGHNTVGLSREDAEEIADLLNTLALLERQDKVH